MLYQAYETSRAMVMPWRLAAGLTTMVIDQLPPAVADLPIVRRGRAICQLTEQTDVFHRRPAFGIDSVDVGRRRPVAIAEEPVLTTPFGTLLHFAKEQPREEPRVLVVAALAGHFSTLMRDTVRTLLSDHDVYLAEWHNARDVPVEEGRFGLDEYIEHLVRFLEELGPGTHVVAVCQPCPATIAAISLLAAEGSAAVPRTLTLMAGPVDVSSNPTRVNQMATSLPRSWFDNVVTTVPIGHPGFGRRVYPGFLQLTAFASMNLGRHFEQRRLLYNSFVEDDAGTASSIQSFYDEYFAVLDMPAEFYLDTIEAVFQGNRLARGELTWRGTLVDPGAIRNTALLTVEGERDDVCGLGQTLAAHDLLSGVHPSNKRHHLQVGVGHYGVFSGHRWQREIYPVVRDWILLHA